MPTIADRIETKEIATATFTPLHRGTVASLDRSHLGPRANNPFTHFGDKMGCTHYTSKFDEGGMEVELEDGSLPREFCNNRRLRLANGFLCSSHDRECFPQGRPSTFNPVLDNMVDARHIVGLERAIIATMSHKTVRLITEDERIKIHKVGFMRVLTTPLSV